MFLGRIHVFKNRYGHVMIYVTSCAQIGQQMQSWVSRVNSLTCTYLITFMNVYKCIRVLSWWLNEALGGVISCELLLKYKL